MSQSSAHMTGAYVIQWSELTVAKPWRQSHKTDRSRIALSNSQCIKARITSNTKVSTEQQKTRPRANATQNPSEPDGTRHTEERAKKSEPLGIRVTIPVINHDRSWTHNKAHHRGNLRMDHQLARVTEESAYTACYTDQ